MIRSLRILQNQKYPILFLRSRLLRDSGLWRVVKIHRPGYLLHLHPAALSMSLWVDANDRHLDSDILKAVLRPGDVYIDVGANIGHLAFEASLIVGESGRVFAFEGHPRTANFLHQNIQLNQLTNIRVMQAVVGEDFGWVGFSDNRSDDQNMVTDSGNITVPLITLDAMLVKESPTLLKIDVEGFEKFVLLGADALIDKTQFIYFEAWDEHFKHNGYPFTDIFDLLTKKKFEIIGFFGSSNLITKISRDAIFPTCVNLLAYRDKNALEERTGWRVE